MKQIIYILFMFFAFIACDETKVGYLEVDEASYDPNTMIVQKRQTGLNGNTLGCLRQYRGYWELIRFIIKLQEYIPVMAMLSLFIMKCN